MQRDWTATPRSIGPRLAWACLTMLAAGATLAGCSEAMHWSYTRAQVEADQDIARCRFQLLTLAGERYISRDSDTGLPICPYRQPSTRSSRAYVQGYNQRMTHWIATHGRPGYNFTPGVPSDSEQLRIGSQMAQPERWVRLEDAVGVTDLGNGWRLRYQRRDDGLYFVWLFQAPVELPPQVTTPMVLPLPDGRLVLIQPAGLLGSLARAVLFDPQSPNSLFLLQ